MRNFIYKNRTEAGRILSDELKDYSDLTNVLVLGLPRGASRWRPRSQNGYMRILM